MNNKRFTTGIAIVVSIVVVYLFFVFGNPLEVVEQGLSASAVGSTSGQLVVQDEVAGTGAAARIGDVVSVHYTAMLPDGSILESSKGGKPFQFVLGAGQVIPGWDQGLQGMKVGGKRLLIVPPDLGYGINGHGSVPPNTTLTFEVELVNIATQ